MPNKPYQYKLVSQLSRPWSFLIAVVSYTQKAEDLCM